MSEVSIEPGPSTTSQSKAADRLKKLRELHLKRVSVLRSYNNLSLNSHCLETKYHLKCQRILLCFVTQNRASKTLSFSGVRLKPNSWCWLHSNE